MNEAQNILEQLPVLSDLIPIIGARTFLRMSKRERAGFTHSNGEWNFLVKHDGRMYRIPQSNMERRALAEQRWQSI